MADTMQIGVASQVITPPLGSQMAGFDARKGVSDGVHDDLHAHAMILESGETRIALVSIEVIAVSADFSRRVRSRIETSIGIPAGHILLSATHTHCGPVTLHHFFNQGQSLDEEYLEHMAHAVVAAVEAAWRSRKPRQLRTGLAPCDGIAINRRTNDGTPVDPFAGVLLVEELDGTAVAVAVNYACHTTVLGPDTLKITQDFPFFTLERLRQQLGANVKAFYFNGAEGDLSVGHKSDLSAVGVVDSFRTFATAQRLGERLADSVLLSLRSLQLQPASLEVQVAEVNLPLKTYPPVEAMSAAREQALRDLEAMDPPAKEQPIFPAFLRAKQKYLFARIEEYYARLYAESHYPEPKQLPVEVIVLRIGNLGIVSLPGEIFVQLALNVRARSPLQQTLFFGLTNDYIGYLPDMKADPQAGYEVVAARVPGEAMEILESAIDSMINKVANAHPHGVV